MSSSIANKIKINLLSFIVRTILCATVSNLYNNNYLFVLLLYSSVLLGTNNCLEGLYNSDLQTAIVLFTRNFTQGWLNTYYSSSALSCPFIVQDKQSNERSWNEYDFWSHIGALSKSIKPVALFFLFCQNILEYLHFCCPLYVYIHICTYLVY